MSILIKGASLFGQKTADILIEENRIVEIGKITAKTKTVIDAAGLIALPGLVDLHTHLREPGSESAETVESGSRAAAAGGFTVVHAMANTNPVADNASVVELVQELGQKAGLVRVRPVGAVTAGLEGERLSDIGGMAKSKAAVRVFSDDGKCVSDPLLMRRALEYVSTFDGVIAQHAQDPGLAGGGLVNEGVISAELGLAPWPDSAEETIIARDVLLAEAAQARLHVCHLSTAGSVEIVRWAKKRGIRVTAEVTPHHLLLTEEAIRGYDTNFKVNPPLRKLEDTLALRKAVADGTIDIVATDHAPHPVSSKKTTFQDAAFGMTGLESALSVVQETLVNEGHLDWVGVSRVLSMKPAEIGGVSGYDKPLEVGSLANLTLVDSSHNEVWNSDRSFGKSANNPYLGRPLPGKIIYTIFEGKPTVFDGTISTNDGTNK